MDTSQTLLLPSVWSFDADMRPLCVITAVFTCYSEVLSTFPLCPSGHLSFQLQDPRIIGGRQEGTQASHSVRKRCPPPTPTSARTTLTSRSASLRARHCTIGANPLSSEALGTSQRLLGLHRGATHQAQGTGCGLRSTCTATSGGLP